MPAQGLGAGRRIALGDLDQAQRHRLGQLEHDELRPGRLPLVIANPVQQGEAIHQQPPHRLVDCFVATLLAMTDVADPASIYHALK
jgi:hypothetical protein